MVNGALTLNKTHHCSHLISLVPKMYAHIYTTGQSVPSSVTIPQQNYTDGYEPHDPIPAGMQETVSTFPFKGDQIKGALSVSQY